MQLPRPRGHGRRLAKPGARGAARGLFGVEASATVFAFGLSAQCSAVVQRVHELLQSGRPLRLNCFGLSRGGCACLMLARRLSDISPERLLISLLLFDPVPGNSITAVRHLDVCGLSTCAACMDVRACRPLRSVLALYPYEVPSHMRPRPTRTPTSTLTLSRRARRCATPPSPSSTGSRRLRRTPTTPMRSRPWAAEARGRARPASRHSFRSSFRRRCIPRRVVGVKQTHGGALNVRRTLLKRNCPVIYALGRAALAAEDCARLDTAVPL